MSFNDEVRKATGYDEKELESWKQQTLVALKEAALRVGAMTVMATRDPEKNGEFFAELRGIGGKVAGALAHMRNAFPDTRRDVDDFVLKLVSNHHYWKSDHTIDPDAVLAAMSEGLKELGIATDGEVN